MFERHIDEWVIEMLLLYWEHSKIVPNVARKT